MSTVLILVLVGLGILGAGFLIGRYYIPDQRPLKRQKRCAESYIKAVNHLLEDDREAGLNAAIDELRELVSDEDIGDIEPYFALGGMFRKKGQWERAIRVHQSVWLREDQDKKIRLRAEYELALDFQHAGMPRKATRALESCLEQDGKHQGALQALTRLYEEQGRYVEAAETMQRLAKVRGVEVPGRHHHLLVAASQGALRQGDIDSAKRLLRDAQRHDSVSVHALVASAELAVERGNFKGASARLEQALEAAPELAHVLVPGLLRAQRELAVTAWEKESKKLDDPAQGEEAEAMLDERAAEMSVEVLERVLGKLGQNGHLELAVAELRSHYDPRTAIGDYDRIAEEFPALLPARVAAARLALARGDAGEIQAELHALAASEGVLAWAMDGAWWCSHCGKRDETFFWRCKHCRTWGSVRLDVGRDALDMPVSPTTRRARELPRGGVNVALLGAATEKALPEPALDSGLSYDEMHQAGQRPSMLGRVGGWFSNAFAGLRSGKNEDEPRTAAAALPARGESSASRASSKPGGSHEAARTGDKHEAARTEGKHEAARTIGKHEAARTSGKHEAAGTGASSGTISTGQGAQRESR